MMKFTLVLVFFFFLLCRFVDVLVTKIGMSRFSMKDFEPLFVKYAGFLFQSETCGLLSGC